MAPQATDLTHAGKTRELVTWDFIADSRIGLHPDSALQVDSAAPACEV